MSNNNGPHETHDTPIKTPKQLITVVILAFVVPVILLIMLANLVTFSSRESSGSDAMTAAATARRIAPVARYEFVDANAPKVFQTGEQVYKQVCTTCHATGVASAPKLGDTVAWSGLIAPGLDHMVAIAIKGQGGMPPKGGNPALSDYEVARAVVFMANQSGASFDEPPVPARDGQTAGASPGPRTAPSTAGSAVAAAIPPAGLMPAAQAPTPAARNDTLLASDASASGGAAPETTPGVPATSTASQATAQINPAGEKFYKTICLVCHAAGVAGAPKFGDKAAWAPYIATGEDAMLKIVISGKGAMPPKGGAITASEDDLRAAVRYMVNATQP